MSASIDLNCDLGEGFANDEVLMTLITSANIACGGHAGDPDTMRRSVAAAVQNNVAIGAHPGYADREHFGRYAADLSADEIDTLVERQYRALEEICNEFGTTITHLKPHGALYNRSASDPTTAAAVAASAKRISPDLILVGLAGSHSIAAGKRLGLRCVSEVFADRTYRADGSLTPRSDADALITDTRTAILQAMQMVTAGTVTATSGEIVPVIADTICLHGDGPHAVDFARSLRDAFHEAGVRVSRFG